MNSTLTMMLKVSAILFLLVSVAVGVSTHNRYSHSGPSCDISDFKYWLKNEGTVVSIYESRVQPKQGVTLCTGSILTPNGDYLDWGGFVEQTSNGVIGKAVLK